MLSGLIGCCFPSEKKNIVAVHDFKIQGESKGKISLQQDNPDKDDDKQPICKSAARVESEGIVTGDMSSDKRTNNRNSKFKKNDIDPDNQSISAISINNHQHCESIKEDFMKNSKRQGSSSKLKDDDIPLNESEFVSEKGDKQLRFISEDEDYHYPSLILNLILGDCFDNKKIEIRASGLIGSKRNARDGIVLFGSKSVGQFDQIIDYELNMHINLNTSVSYPTLVFMIYFKKDMRKFYIRACKNNQDQDGALPSILVQITKPYVSLIKYFKYLKSKELLLLNDCCFHMSQHDGYLEIMQHPSKHSQVSESYRFFIKDKKEILIGRDSSCDIKLSWDNTYSKFQTSIIYDEEIEHWKIVDGGPKGPSRNGTWLFASKSFEVYDGCVFRVASSKVQIKMKYNSEFNEQESH